MTTGDLTRTPPAARAPAARTPLMQQYARIKQQVPDAFLFFRLGDFYEMFFEDAVRGAAILGLTLTSRNKQDPEPIPMCGIPWHQRDGYVGRLLRLGHKVAICDQLEEPTAAKGLVDRGVTEVLTPGSVTGDGFLDPSANNFLAAVWPGPDRFGICLADASTGEIKLLQCETAEAADVLARLAVAEWVTPLPAELPSDDAARLGAVLAGLAGARSPVPAARFEDVSLLARRWGEDALLAVVDLPLAVRAATAAVDYLDRVQGGLALQLRRVERWAEDDVLRYDTATARHLELFEPGPGGEAAHTLWQHLDRCVTAPGSRRLRAWLERPLAEPRAIERRLDAVERWRSETDARTTFRSALRAFPDLERLAARVACARATPRDLGAVRDALRRLPGLAQALTGLVAPDDPRRLALAGAPTLLGRLEAALVDDPPMASKDGGVFRPGFDPERDALDDLAHSGKRWILELESQERTRTGIPSLKVGFNRVFGYYLEVTRAHRDKVPDDYERRQTLTTAERFVTPELKRKEGEVLSAEQRLHALEHERFLALRDETAQHVEALERAATALATLDAEAALAEAAARYAWHRPVVDGSDRLELDEARHPTVERLMPAGTFVPNELALDATRRQILLLTGPNMGGKSTYLRQTALIVLLAHAGSFVPARGARIGRVDRLFTRVGSADRLGKGQSTFMVEMQETAAILRCATPRSLVLLDELGRGTATYDGLAIAWAVTEHLHDARGPRPRTIFATHYHELTQLAERLPRVANAHVEVLEQGSGIVFLHRVVEGPADRSYGIHVARLAGLPAAVLARADEVLRELESERTVEHLAQGDGRPRARSPAPPQLALFSSPRHPLLDELAALDPERLTPLEALQRLAEWRRRWSTETP